MPREPGGRPPAGRRGFGTPLRLAGVGACALVLVVAVAGLAGGLDEIPEPAPPAVAVDQLHPGEPWNLTVTNAILAVDLSPASLQEEGNHWLVVAATVEVTAPESRSDIRQALYPVGVAGLLGEPAKSGVVGAIYADEVMLVRDGARLSELHPGLPERVAFLWEQAAGAPPPTGVEVRLVGMTLRESTLNGHLEWLDPAPRARVTVPVRDRRDAGTGGRTDG